MAKSRSELKKNESKFNKYEFWHSKEERKIIPPNKNELITMKKGYRAMAEINLAISTLYFDIESEAESYYDRIAECEKRCK